MNDDSGYVFCAKMKLSFSKMDTDYGYQEFSNNLDFLRKRLKVFEKIIYHKVSPRMREANRIYF